jgi:hypothetical protein
VTDRSIQIIRTGTVQPAPVAIPLCAGPVRAIFTDGDLRQVRRGGIEVARRVYVAVRDLDWNTITGDMTGLQVDDQADCFAIRFTRRHQVGEIDYQWDAEIRGDTDGVISYRMRGEALGGFPYAKIGICVHHPTDGYTGRPYRGSAPDGPVSGTLPDAIGPQIHLDDGTDLPLFQPVSDLDVTHASGGLVRFEFAGSLWEMEDQRNWTDASYKSASTPAKLGYHHEASPGQQFDQEVVIRTIGFEAAAAAARPADTALTITVGGASGHQVPPVGLRCTDIGSDATWSDRALSVLRAIGPAHLRADIRLAADSAAADIAAATDRARELSCGLELAVFLPAAVTARAAALDRLCDGLVANPPALARVLAFGEAEESTSPETVAAVQAALAAAGAPAVPVIAGTNIYFNELNRHRLPPGRAAGLAWSVNPQVHAFDDMSLMENLQAQPDTLATARSYAPGTGLYVTPITLRPRFNAVAVTDQEFPAGGLPWQVDIRQPSLFAAAWTVGSVAALATAGADGLTYYDAVGPAGVIESPAGSPSPAEFFSRPDTPYPLAVVLADACGLAGGQVRGLAGVDPLQVAALAVSRRETITVLLANLTAAALEVRIAVPGADTSPARLRVLDERTFEAAVTGFERFLASGADILETEGAVTVTLNPYAVARLDVTGG